MSYLIEKSMESLYLDLADLKTIIDELFDVLANEPDDERHRKIYRSINTSALNDLYLQIAEAIDDD